MQNEREIDPIDLLSWLNAIPIYPKIYWSDRDQKSAIAAAGVASGENHSARRFGWRHFAPTTASEWRDFASSFFFVPRFVFIHKNNRAFFRDNSKSPHSISFSKKQEPLNNSPIQIRRISSLPSRTQWIDQIGKTLQAIQNHQFEKVVLARRICIDCSMPIDPLALCRSSHADHQTVFFIQPTPASAFIGASPEMLFERIGLTIRCDALAGTRQSHQSNELFNSEKDRHEFLIVQNMIIEALAPHCCFTPTASQPMIRPAGSISHIHSQIAGVLHHKITDEQLLDTLHPTPAVGGYPSKEALAYLSGCEPFARGLYAAPLGWSGSDSAEFTIGIRSCLIQSNRAYLYAGTGIVAGSDPLLEWEETKYKLAKWNPFFGNFDE